MQNNRKVFDVLMSKTKIYLAIIFILLVIISIENKIMILPSIIIYTIIVIYSYYTNNKRKSEISETLQDLTLTVDTAAKTSLISSPFPLIILQTDGNIIWRSSKFNSEFANIDMNTYIDDLSAEIKEEIEKIYSEVSDLIERLEFREATEKIMDLVEKANKYYDTQEPWKQIKEDKQAFKNTIFTCANIIANLSNLFEPIMPTTTKKIREYLELPEPSWKPIYIEKEIDLTSKNIEPLFERLKID